MGYVGTQLDTFEDNLFHTQVVASLWGKKMEDLQKLQNSYTDATGRNIQFTDSDFTKSFAMGTFWGDDTIAELNSGMEIFNMSVSDSNEQFYEMQKSLNKIGLNGRKYGKNLIQDLKLAEKHTFNGGVKGLMEMSKWAQNVRFNTSSLDSMLTKVQEGGLEGVVKQAAELQVLGGHFAMGSDPLGMGWESLNDPAAYAKRVNGMLKGLGVFNSETGQVEVKGVNRIIANQAAQSLGMSVEDLIKQVTQDVKSNKIKGVMGNGFTDDQYSMIANKAQYVNGEWKVNIGKKDTQGKSVLTNVSELTPQDIERLVDDSNKSLEEMAQESLSIQRREEALQNTMTNSQMDMYKFMKGEHLQRIQNIWSNYLGEAGISIIK